MEGICLIKYMENGGRSCAVDDAFYHDVAIESGTACVSTLHDIDIRRHPQDVPSSRDHFVALAMSDEGRVPARNIRTSGQWSISSVPSKGSTANEHTLSVHDSTCA